MKPECEEALRDIERFLDEEMAPPERMQLDTHLHECSPCMERADFKRQVRQLVASRCGCDEIPQALKDKVMQMLGEPHSNPPAGV